MSELLKQFQNLVSRSNNMALIARHIGCDSTQLIAFHSGSEGALNTDQKLALADLILDLYSGKVNSGGFYLDEQGKLMWSSK